MIFSSNLFVFGFMPIFFAAYYLAPWRAKNALVLLASLAFYEFGAGPIVLVLILSIFVNYGAARAIEAARGSVGALIFWLALAANLMALFYYKYFDFAWHALDDLAGGALAQHGFAAPKIVLPIGISFFTFQAVSYIADVYTGHTPAEPSLVRFGMYHSLFPQLIAGPIVRYVEIRNEIAARGAFIFNLPVMLARDRPRTTLYFAHSKPVLLFTPSLNSTRIPRASGAESTFFMSATPLRLDTEVGARSHYAQR